MKKVIAGILVICLAIGGTVGCASIKAPQQPPKIVITIGEKQIEYVNAKNKWDNALYDREDTFQTILKKETEAEFPAIEIGKTVTVDFGDTIPNQLKIEDILLNDIDRSGKQVFYHQSSPVTVAFKQANGKYTFPIEKNIASAASSKYVENKKDIRGFRIIASWGQNECEYAFIIRTDAL